MGGFKSTNGLLHKLELYVPVGNFQTVSFCYFKCKRPRRDAKFIYSHFYGHKYHASLNRYQLYMFGLENITNFVSTDDHFIAT